MLDQVVNQLLEEKQKTVNYLKRLDQAIGALNGDGAAHNGSAPKVIVERKRSMSLEARAKISRAQKARWRKLK
jgi:hypothetical protein